MKKKRMLPQLILNLFILLLLFLMLYPLAMAVWNALKSDIAYSYSRWYPTLPLRIGNVLTAGKEVLRYVLNTVFAGGIGISLCLILSTMASYSFARIDFPGRRLLYKCVILLMMIPGVLTLVPSFMLYRSLGLLNSYLVLIIPVMINGSVFGVFLLTSFFEGLPADFFERCV